MTADILGASPAPAAVSLTSHRAEGKVAEASIGSGRHQPSLLFATNGSPEAEAACRFAAALAERDGLLLRIVTALEPIPALPAQPPGAAYHMGVEIENAERILVRVRASIRRSLPRDLVITSMLIGTPGATIAKAAREWNSQYVVLGAGRRGHLERLLVGDTVMQVVHHSVAPVIVVPASRGVLPRTGIVALDFGPASMVAARNAARLIGAGVLYLVHVRPALDVPAPDSEGWTEVHDLMTRLARELTETYHDVRIETVLLQGHPVERLTDFAGRTAADLIAVGQHGHGTVERLRFGSVAHALVRGAQCPVLVAPPAAAIE